MFVAKFNANIFGSDATRCEMLAQALGYRRCEAFRLLTDHHNHVDRRSQTNWYINMVRICCLFKHFDRLIWAAAKQLTVVKIEHYRNRATELQVNCLFVVDSSQLTNGWLNLSTWAWMWKWTCHRKENWMHLLLEVQREKQLARYSFVRCHETRIALLHVDLP